MHKLQKKEKVELSIIILSYNTKGLLEKCLESLYTYYGDKISEGEWELIVADNGSSDGSQEVLKENAYKGLLFIDNKNNLGFAKGNNVVAKMSKGEFVLFLNPDTIVEKESISFPLAFIKGNCDVGAVTAKTVLANGDLDVTCHRGFPTPWNAFCFFSGMSRIFPHSKLFSGYLLGSLDLNTPHEVEAINGAYFLMPRDLGTKLGWFDEDFFWKGEDLDLCYRIKQLGKQVWYLPQVKIWHFKGASKGHKPGSKSLQARFDVMRIFYEKHYRNKYPWLVKQLVFLGINLKHFLANKGI